MLFFGIFFAIFRSFFVAPPSENFFADALDWLCLIAAYGGKPKS